MPRQGHNTPIPLERSAPASFKRLLGSDERHTSTYDAPSSDHKPNAPYVAPQRKPRGWWLGRQAPFATKALALALAEYANSHIHRYGCDREGRECCRKSGRVWQLPEPG